MTILLVVLSVLVALAGALFVNEATMGVGLLAGACWLGIMARIAQAAEHRQPKPPEPNERQG